MNTQADTKAVCQLANDVRDILLGVGLQYNVSITASSNDFLRLENSDKIMKVRSTKNILKGAYEREI